MLRTAERLKLIEKAPDKEFISKLNSSGNDVYVLQELLSNFSIRLKEIETKLTVVIGSVNILSEDKPKTTKTKKEEE